MGVVAEAVMFLFRIVQHQPQLHALAGQFAIGHAAHTGQYGGEPDPGIAFCQLLARLAARRPLGGHPGEIIDQ